MSDGGIDELAAARLWAATRFPYLTVAIFGIRVVADRGGGAVWVDETWRVHADPELATTWTPAQLGSVLVHHACHLLRDHAVRARAAGVGPERSRTWVRAADAEINDDLVTAGLELPGRPILPRDLGAVDGLLAEQYFDGLRPPALQARGTRDRACSSTGARSRRAGDDGAAEQWLDCGSGADGVARPRGGPSGLSPWQAELLRREVAHDVIARGDEAADVPVGWLRWANEMLSPKIDWRTVIGAELRRAVADVSGAVDYSYRRPSRRAIVSGNVVLPALRRPVPEVAIVCDISDSITANLLTMALAEVEQVLRTLGLSRRVTVLACSTVVASTQRVRSARQVRLVGGGGTNMGAGIAAAARLRPRPTVTMVLTDGHTPWPPVRPQGMRVVVGLLGSRAPDAPWWARAVRIGSVPA